MRALAACLVVAGALGFGLAGADPAPRSVAPPGEARAETRPEDADPRTLPGWNVYVKQCAPCHGEKGDGQGPAARFMDPRPRDFTIRPFRFVSTANDVPSGKDLFETVAAGVGGTAMMSFMHLGEAAVWSAIDVVLAFRRQGLRQMLAAGGLVGAELETTLDARTTPVLCEDEAGAPPETVDSAARGLVLWRGVCASCHGIDGRAANAEGRLTVEGDPCRPRDLGRGVLKQLPTKANLFTRIRRGMPGTPMPGTPITSLKTADAWDLVHYMRTLIPANAQPLASAGVVDLPFLPLVGEPPVTPDDPRFAAAPATWIPLLPFRADEATTPGLMVQALVGDGVLSLRCLMPDATANIPTATVETAPDGLAVRATAIRKPPILPVPGQPTPIDRALALTGPLPERDDPLWTALPKFDNRDAVCRAVFGPDRVGAMIHRSGVWHITLTLKLDQAGMPGPTRVVSVSFAAFDGQLRRGPMPTAFSMWNELAPR